MKNYNKILEAVNRGIRLALDDFDDEEQVLHVKSKQVLNRDYTKEYLDLMKEVVDLGLPSGTLWCKYNLDVDSDLLTSPEDWYGKYYAWGELETKLEYSWGTYKFAKNGVGNDLTKYVTDSNFGAWDKRVGFIEDHLTKLRPEDDAAYLNKKLYNYKFYIPTKELFEELIKYTQHYLVNNYDPNKIKHNPEDDGGIKGLNGRIFEGKNGSQLFIPMVGYRYGSDICIVGSHCYLWSSSLDLDDPEFAHFLYFESDYIYVTSNYRYFGLPIRPVINL